MNDVSPQLLVSLETAALAFITEYERLQQDSAAQSDFLDTPEGAELFQRFCNKWTCRRQFRTYHSVRSISRRLRLVVRKLLTSRVDVAGEILALALSLVRPTCCDVILPLNNIDLRNMSLLLSDDVTAAVITEDRFDLDIAPAYRAAASREKTASTAIETLLAVLRQRVVGRTALVIRADGDEDVALWAAERRADLAVDVLQFMSATSAPRQYRVFIDWRGYSPQNSWRDTVVVSRTDGLLPVESEQQTGTLEVWTPTTTDIAGMQTFDYFKFLLLPLRRQRTFHEDMLARAISAYAHGDRAASTDEKKLWYVTVFDLFFSRPDTNITESLREGVAFTMLWDLQNEDLDEERLRIANFIGSVYNSRSRTTHEFQTGIFEPDDLEWLSRIARHFILAMWWNQDFRSKDDVSSWLDACRQQLGARRYAPFARLSRPS